MLRSSIIITCFQVLKDHHLAGIVTGFVIIDIIILGMYLIIEGVRENHRAILVRSAEHPEAQIGVSIAMKFLSKCIFIINI